MGKFDRKAYMKAYNARYRIRNKEKIVSYNLEYKARNKAPIKDKRPAYREKNSFKIKKQVRERKYLARYGITTDIFNLMCADQDFECAICGQQVLWPKKLHVDHDHRTLTIRGLLCGNCNRGLGMFGDDVETIKKAVKYLRENRYDPK
jgi:hypothetical protein